VASAEGRMSPYVAWCPMNAAASARSPVAIDEINLVLSVSETHNQANMRMSATDSLRRSGVSCQQARGTSTVSRDHCDRIWLSI